MSTDAEPWSAAVFSSRETLTTLLGTINALRVAGGPSLKIDLLLNGGTALVEEFLAFARVSPQRMSGIHVWHCPFTDKAHVWNEFVHRVWDGRAWSFNVDGYVVVRPDALQRLRHGLRNQSGYLASTGIPTTGRFSASLGNAMLRDGGLHGNLFLMMPSTLQAFRDQSIRLPIGLYRTDATIGAVMAFGMDPSRNEWSPKSRLLVDPQVTWTTPEKHWWEPRELSALWRRRSRQARGRLENAAVRHHLAIQRRHPKDMPARVADLLCRWADEDPTGFREVLWRSPFAWRYWRKLRRTATIFKAESPPPALQLLACFD